ncbi:MAG: hypothetical protein UT82_C0012G0018 [Parcubacteria group bacterium GW2011_GWB1_40_14]|nr:MAG: hypothetical protein UT82_C0012G0018 [Parcubacteria group bacterium GW2011_GWB1_40_14]
MDYIIGFGVIILFGLWYLDRALANLKKEQDAKLSSIQASIVNLQSDFDEKFGDDETSDD